MYSLDSLTKTKSCYEFFLFRVSTSWRQKWFCHLWTMSARAYAITPRSNQVWEVLSSLNHRRKPSYLWYLTPFKTFWLRQFNFSEFEFENLSISTRQQKFKFKKIFISFNGFLLWFPFVVSFHDIFLSPTITLGRLLSTSLKLNSSWLAVKALVL